MDDDCLFIDMQAPEAPQHKIKEVHATGWDEKKWT
jgi:hypothetical protein